MSNLLSVTSDGSVPFLGPLPSKMADFDGSLPDFGTVPSFVDERPLINGVKRVSLTGMVPVNSMIAMGISALAVGAIGFLLARKLNQDTEPAAVSSRP